MPLEFQPYNPGTGKFQRARKLKPIQSTKRLGHLSGLGKFSLTSLVTPAKETADFNGNNSISDARPAYRTQHNHNLARVYKGETNCQSCEMTTPVYNKESPPQQLDMVSNLSSDTASTLTIESARESTTSYIPMSPLSESPEISRGSPSNNLLPPASPDSNMILGSEEASERTVSPSHDMSEISTESPITPQEPRADPIEKPALGDGPIPSEQTMDIASPDIILVSLQTTGQRKRIRNGLKDTRWRVTKTGCTGSPKKPHNITTQQLAEPTCENEDTESCIYVSNSATCSSTTQNQEDTIVSSMSVDWEIEKIIGSELIDDIQYYLVCWKATRVPECQIDFIRTQGDMYGEPREDEVIDGVLHYLVAWKPSLVPEHEIDAPELVRGFEATIQGMLLSKDFGEQ